MPVEEQVPAVPPVRSGPDTSQNWLGIVALVTGLVGLGIVAIVFGALGIRAARDGRATNRGMALAGVILGAVGVLVAIAVTVVLVLAAVTVRDAASTGDVAPTPAASAPAPVVPADATRFVLVPDESSDPELLDAAAAFLLTRVGANVVVDPSGVLVVELDTPPGDGFADALLRPTFAQLRPVVARGGPAPSSGSTWPDAVDAPSWAGDPSFYAAGDLGARYDRTDCTVPEQIFGTDTSDPDPGVVACGSDGSVKYLLGSAPLTDRHLESVSVDGSTVTVTFTTEGASVLADLTAQLAGQPAPRNQVAMVTEGSVSSAPSVASPITGGVIEMDLGDEEAARQMAGALTFGSPLMRLSLQSAEE